MTDNNFSVQSMIVHDKCGVGVIIGWTTLEHAHEYNAPDGLNRILNIYIPTIKSRATHAKVEFHNKIYAIMCVPICELSHYVPS